MLKTYPVETNEDIEHVKILLEEYFDWLENNKCISSQESQAFEEQLANLPKGFTPPDACILLGMYQEEIAGCVALRKLNDTACEMKRLYVKQKFRGLKIGKRLVEAIIAEARIMGYSSIRGDTVPIMHIAQALYVSLGFTEIEAYCYNPIEGAVFIELKLK